MKKLLPFFALLILPELVLSQNSSFYNQRSDTIDLLHTEINLDITDFTTDTIRGYADLRFTPLMNGRNSISLDLLKMTIDSVVLNTVHLTYGYNDTLLVCYFASTLNTGDTVNLKVYYHGKPQMDPSGWGGFYFQSGYAYNLGVGFQSLPHNYGRVWHPCFDNFTERCTYTFRITTNGGKTSYCNGYIAKDTVIGGNNVRTWEMENSIPSYLACVGVNNYVHVNQKYISPVTGDTIPIMLISLPADTTAFKGSFVNLNGALQAFEESYGPYRWNKVGYVAVPFSSGAMEHATAISYPKATINGNTLYETLYAHELSHHWWGDLVTCETAEEMWINEGMARYSEALFLEKKYNYGQYIGNIKSNHKNVLWKAHVNDGGFYAINNVPQAVTYGDHSYLKGADVVHTLRTYMGDSLFFAGLKSITANNQYTNVNSVQFRDQLNLLAGVNVTDFFNDWVFNPGFPVFMVDSFNCSGTAPNVTVTVYVRQKLKAAPAFYSNVPMQVNFQQAFTSYSASTVLNGQTSTLTFNNVPFVPDFVYLNGDDKISQGVTGENLVIQSTGTKSISYANFTFTVLGVTDSTWVRAEQYWTAADSFKINQFEYVISPDRFWKIYMSHPQNLNAQGKITYNGTTGASGNLDNGLLTNWGSVAFREDSLHLFYRATPADDWTECAGYHFTFGSMTDKQGTLFIDSLKNGEYALAFKLSSTAIPHIVNEKMQFRVYPNPGDGRITIEAGGLSEKNLYVQVTDATGRQVDQIQLDSLGRASLTKDYHGMHLFTLVSKGHCMATQRVIFE